MNVLVMGEYSGRIRDAFIKMGHGALSCDLLPTESPGPHYKGDVRDIINNGWDMMIAHPDCTYLTTSAEWAYSDNPMIKGKPRRMKPGTLTGAVRRIARVNALDFVRELLASPIEKICLENPRGVIGSHICKASQYIQPHEYGHDASKTTGLWLKNLPFLVPTHHIAPRIVNGLPRWANQTDSGQNILPPSATRGKDRAKTYQGWADAMASQWGGFL